MQGLLTGLRPDLTPAQIVAFLIAGVPSIFVLLGVDLAPDQAGALDRLLWLAGGLFGADVLLRGARNLRDAKVEAAALAPVPPAVQVVGGVPPVGPGGDLGVDGALDSEERELLQAMERGELPSHEDEFEPVGRATPDDPDGGGISGISAVPEGGEFPPARGA